MKKEIHEQPKAVADTLASVLKDGNIDLAEMGLCEEEIKEIESITIVACGSCLACWNDRPVCVRRYCKNSGSALNWHQSFVIENHY